MDEEKYLRKLYHQRPTVSKHVFGQRQPPHELNSPSESAPLTAHPHLVYRSCLCGGRTPSCLHRRHHDSRTHARSLLHSLMISLLLALIVLLAATQQTLTGFGFALLLMPLAVHLVGISVAAPFVAAIALLLYAINLVRQHQALAWAELRRLGLWAALGAPLGIVLAGRLDEQLLRQALGVLLVAYTLYRWGQRKVVLPISRRWAYVAGFAAGCLGGAYNIPGPPLILYGALRQWPRQRFRAVLQAVFLLNGVIVVGTHILSRHYTPAVLSLLPPAIPALLLGVTAGAWLDRRVSGRHLHLFIQFLILLLGLSLIFRS